MARIICEVQPRFVFVENSPILTSRGLGRVLGDLAEMGFNARWGVFSAADAGARHLRERIWILADSMQNRWSESSLQNNNGPKGTQRISTKWGVGRVKSDVVQTSGRALDAGRMALSDDARTLDAVATIVDRLAATGNGQVPAVVKLAWETLIG